MKTRVKVSKITLEQIRERLVDAIKYSGIKQCEIANAIGVGESSISQYMSGLKMPSLENFARLCDVLDIDANYLLGITNI